MKLSPEQGRIVYEARNSNDDLIVESGAGCGKTSTLLEILKVIKQQSVLMVAFNKRIADELTVKVAKLPGRPKSQVVHVKTFHALGLSIIKHHYPDVSVDQNATEELVRSIPAARGASFEVRRAAVRLVRAAKEIILSSSVGTPAIHNLLDLGFDYGLFSVKMKSAQIEAATEIAAISIEIGRRGIGSTIDFCDMVWYPLVLGLKPPSRYQAIFVDELQDISAPQVELLKLLALPTTRRIAAGDINQQIYGWRGSLGATAWASFGNATRTQGYIEPGGIQEVGVKRLPLTVTWRCGKAIVKQANELVPDLKAAPDADDGSVSTCGLNELPARIGQGSTNEIHSYVLSRKNAPLLDCALLLWRSGVKFQLNAGKEILNPVIHLLDYELDLRSESTFRSSLESWHKLQATEADRLGSTALRERADECKAMLMAALRYAKPTMIKGLLNSILSPNDSGVLLSSVHKVKGLEARCVFLLRQSFARYSDPDFHITIRKVDRQVDPESPLYAAAIEDSEYSLPMHIPQEELNIEYVAITRAKEHLIWVNMDQTGDLRLDDNDLSTQSDAWLMQKLTDFERMAALATNNRQTEEGLRYFAAARLLNGEIKRRGGV